MSETNAESAGPIRFAGATLTKNHHVCAFFHNPDEEYRVLLPFIKEGFERGDKAFHVVDPKRRASHLGRLQSGGIEVKEAQQTGQLEVRNWEDSTLRDGHFDQYRMLALIEQILAENKSGMSKVTRWIGQMEWALEDRPGLNDFVEFESRVNYISRKYRDPLV
jgi:hypothetical protein